MAKKVAKTMAKLQPRARKTSAKKTKRAAASPVKSKATAQPKQVFNVNHLRPEDFRSDGLRTYAQYRDLGIAEASHGLAQAHVIRLIGPCNPAEVSKLHFHDVEFQMVYVLKGWIKTELEGQGAHVMRPGSAWLQPPKIKHKVLDYSDDCEVLEIILPADFETTELD